MIEVSGKVSYKSPSTSGSKLGREACLNQCLEKEDCVLSYLDSNGYCINYDYSSVLIITVTRAPLAEGFVVAFKVEMPEPTCPSSLNSITLTGTVDSKTYTWTETEPGWFLTNLCPSPWKLIERANLVTICMRPFVVEKTNTTREKAQNFCEQNGWQLTGLETEEELKAIGTTNWLWIDGTSPPCEGTCDVNKFTFTDGYTTKVIINEPQSLILNSPIEIGIILAGAYGKTTNYQVSVTVDGAVCGFRVE